MATRTLAAALLLIATVLAVAACTQRDTSLERIQGSGQLRIGLDPTYPPFELADETGVGGLDVDLARGIAAGLGVEPAFSYFGYDGLYDALLTDQVDVLVSALVVSPERTRDFAYSRPYFDAGQVLIVPAGSAITGTDDLRGQRVAVELGALGHVEALGLARSQPGLTVVPYGSADEALAATANGDTGATLIDGIGGRLYLRTDQSGLRLLPEPVTSEPFAVVVRIEDEALLQQIDVELSRMKSDGHLAELIGRWLGP